MASRLQRKNGEIDLLRSFKAPSNDQLLQTDLANGLENLFVERMGGNEEIFVRLMNDAAFRDIAANHLLHAVYSQIRAAK